MEDESLTDRLYVWFSGSCAVQKRKLEKSWRCVTADHLPFRREVRKTVRRNTDT